MSDPSCCRLVCRARAARRAAAAAVVRRARGLALVVALAGIGAAPPAQAAGGAERSEPSFERAREARCLYHLAAYTSWPPDALPAQNAPFVVAVVGPDPFGAELEAAFAGKRLHGRAVELSRADEWSELAEPQVVFFAELADADRARLLETFRFRPILVIAEGPERAGEGVGVGLVPRAGARGTKLDLQVNRAALKRARLQLSSQVLKLAQIVEERKP